MKKIKLALIFFLVALFSFSVFSHLRPTTAQAQSTQTLKEMPNFNLDFLREFEETYHENLRRFAEFAGIRQKQDEEREACEGFLIEGQCLQDARHRALLLRETEFEQALDISGMTPEKRLSAKKDYAKYGCSPTDLECLFREFVVRQVYERLTGTLNIYFSGNLQVSAIVTRKCFGTETKTTEELRLMTPELKVKAAYLCMEKELLPPSASHLQAPLPSTPPLTASQTSGQSGSTGQTTGQPSSSSQAAAASMGRGVWIYISGNASGGNQNAICSKAKNTGLGHIIVKTHDGSSWFRTNSETWFQGLISACNAQGIKVFGYGRGGMGGLNPDIEADGAIKVLQMGAGGYVFDDESEYKGKAKEAETKLSKVKTWRDQNAQGKILAYSSFAFRRYHGSFPFAVYDYYCDVAMPQVYWKSFESSGFSFSSTMTIFQEDWKNAPISVIPVGQAYGRNSGFTYIPASEVKNFVEAMKKQGRPGINIWRYELMDEDHWQAIKQ